MAAGCRRKKGKRDKIWMQWYCGVDNHSVALSKRKPIMETKRADNMMGLGAAALGLYGSWSAIGVGGSALGLVLDVGLSLRDGEIRWINLG